MGEPPVLEHCSPPKAAKELLIVMGPQVLHSWLEVLEAQAERAALAIIVVADIPMAPAEPVNSAAAAEVLAQKAGTAAPMEEAAAGLPRELAEHTAAKAVRLPPIMGSAQSEASIYLRL